MARLVGRYLVHDAIAVGGMGAVHLARVLGSGGFARTVAVKRLHEHLAGDHEIVSMFLDEARIAARVHHPNVVATLDVVADGDDFLLVMDHVLGVAWSSIVRALAARGVRAPLPIVSAVMSDTLAGLHAAHEALGEDGQPLQIVHRDVSPQNILVGADGIARVVDFGIAKAVARLHETQGDRVKGKLAYMAAEQMNRRPVDRRTDLHALGVVLWEALAGERLRAHEAPGSVLASVLEGGGPSLSSKRQDLPAALDALVARALSADPEERPESAAAMARELTALVPRADAAAVAAFVADVARDDLAERRRRVAEVERSRSAEPSPVSASTPAGATPSEHRALASAETELSVVTPAQAAQPPARRSRYLIAVAAVVFLFGATPLAARWVTTTSDTQSRAQPPPGAAREDAHDDEAFSAARHLATPSATGSDSPRELAVPSNANEDEPRARPAPEATSSVGGSPASRPPPPTTKRRPPHATPRPTGTTRGDTADCTPNYTIDANGLKHFKPWCL